MNCLRVARGAFALAGFMAMTLAAPHAASAADTTLRVLGWNGGQPQQDVVERPTWDHLEEKTNGLLAAQFRTLDELGLKGPEALRTLKSGAFDIVSIQVSFVSGDDAVFVGGDLPGTASSPEEVRKINEAYASVLGKHLADAYDAKLLAVWSYPPQILYCKGDVKTLADLKGKKVRSQSAAASAAVGYLGGTVVSLAGPEVYQAMLQGVVDCAITGSQYAAANDWQEVANVVFPLPFGGNGVAIHVIRNQSWNKLSPEQQDALTKTMNEMDETFWKMAVDSNQDGLNCNTGEGPCSTGRPGKMTEIAVTDADQALMKKVLKEVILPSWLNDCNRTMKDCAVQWTDTIGKQIGIDLTQ
jgi:TRAP-type C4-dicarboxylate transport system substrate-binding protein